jgi:hypothetical protein
MREMDRLCVQVWLMKGNVLPMLNEALCHEVVRGIRGIAPLIYDLGAVWR